MSQTQPPHTTDSENERSEAAKGLSEAQLARIKDRQERRSRGFISQKLLDESPKSFCDDWWHYL